MSYRTSRAARLASVLAFHGHERTPQYGEGPAMAWGEWEQMKAQAAERQSTRMRLNQLPAEGGRRRRW
ncbi:hypothetical protein GCM10020256_18870 [Streptomyces thermocoprophilus]